MRGEDDERAREREPGEEWRCPRDRGRRGDLQDALGADKRDQWRRMDATGLNTRRHRRAPPP